MKFKINYKDFVNRYPGVYKTALFYPKFLKLKKSKLSLQEIHRILKDKVSRQTVYFWFKDKRIPLPFKEFSKIKRVFSNNDLENLATIVGHVIGDGGIDKRLILHYCNTEQFLIDEFQNAMKNSFNAKPMAKYKERSGITRLQYPRIYSRALLCLFGNFAYGEHKEITQKIEKMPMWWKVKLLQALYNDDGSIPDSGHYMGVTFKQKNKYIISWIQKTLKELNINSRLTKDGACWHLRITNYLDIVKFRDKVNFSKRYRKQIHLDEIIKKIKYPHWGTKNQILQLLKKRARTRKELTNLLSLDPGTVYGHLHGWKRVKKKSNYGLIDLGFVKVRKVRRINLYYV